MNSRMLFGLRDELLKIAYREAPWMTPEQKAHWKSLQGPELPLPTQIEPAFAKSHTLLQKQLSDLPLVGGMGEYYEEAMPEHLRTGGGPLTAEARKAALQTGSWREKVLNKRLKDAGLVYKLENSHLLRKTKPSYLIHAIENAPTVLARGMLGEKSTILSKLRSLGKLFKRAA